MIYLIGVDRYRARAATIAALGHDADALLRRLLGNQGVHGAVVLATCARVEVYVDAPRYHDAHRAVLEAWAASCAVPVHEINQMATTLRGAGAVEHLFRVASGLESAVVGEDQIVGQVRSALRQARLHGATTRTLDMAFENAVRVSRQARPLLVQQANRPASVAGAAIDQAISALGHAPGIALVIGTGRFAATCVTELIDRGAHTILVHSPSGRPTRLGAEVTGPELGTALALADVVIAASGHGLPVLTASLVDQAQVGRARPLAVLDLAMGDVDPSIQANPDVLVIGLDDVRSDTMVTEAADAHVREQAAALTLRIADRELDEVIITLRSHVEAAAARAGDPGADENLRRLTSTLLHEPTLRARRAAQSGDLERFRSAVEMLFGTSVGTPA
jgi:glutamyl-tRNA reductase